MTSRNVNVLVELSRCSREVEEPKALAQVLEDKNSFQYSFLLVSLLETIAVMLYIAVNNVVILLKTCGYYMYHQV